MSPGLLHRQVHHPRAMFAERAVLAVPRKDISTCSPTSSPPCADLRVAVLQSVRDARRQQRCQQSRRQRHAHHDLRQHTRLEGKVTLDRVVGMRS